MFLPNNYEAPKAQSSYMKLEDGENRIRILSAPILGWEEWDNKKPIRYRFNNKPDQSIDPSRPPRHFWAMVVWNYRDASVQILEVTQASVRKRLEALANDAEWGAPYHYDIKILRDGEGKETSYVVNPSPHRAIDQSIVNAFKAKPIRLEALFEGKDPFAIDYSFAVTVGYFDVSSAPTPLTAKATSAKPATPQLDVPPSVDYPVDIEYFMDFMPAYYTRDTVEEFVMICSKAANLDPEIYMRDTLDNLPNFVSCYDKWVTLKKKTA